MRRISSSAPHQFSLPALKQSNLSLTQILI
nr:MAG TPA: hypothetical protein [Caudoviricetes sp.]